MTITEVLLAKIEDLEKENKNLKECNTMLVNFLLKECPSMKKAIAKVFTKLGESLEAKND